MEAFTRMWQGCHEGQHIEELISGVFSDFAPYAGAEHQRLSFVRQYETSGASGVTVEETGDLIFNVGHTAAGSTVFTTTGLEQVEANIKIPLRPVTLPSFGADESVHASAPVSAHLERTKPATPATADAEPSVKRFIATRRGAQLFFGIPPVARLPPASFSPSAGLAKAFGQLELEANVPALWQGRCAVGVRAGPLAARLSRAPTLVDAPGATRDRSQSELSGSLQDTTTLRNETTAATEKREAVVYTVDTSACLPVGELTTHSETVKESARSRLVLNVGLQHPFSASLPIAGDTLAAVALQNDRGVSERYQSHASDAHATPDPATGGISGDGEGTPFRFPSPPESTFRFLVVQTLMSASSAAGNVVDGSGLLGTSGASPSRLQNTSGGSSYQDFSGTGYSPTGTSGGTRGTSGGSGRPWYSLPTLVGCNVSFQRQLVRLSAASIFHDGEVDVETAAIVDMTPLVPSTPTLIKMGWNNTGRLALGITSFFYNALCITLGAHVMPGEDVRFGLEIKM